LSLNPSLLDKVHANIRAGYDEFALFELGRAHIKGIVDDEKLPRELKRLGMVLGRKNSLTGAPYYHARWFLDGLLLKLGINDLIYRPLAEVKQLAKQWRVAAGAYEPARTALVFSADKNVVGLIGEPTARLRESLKLPAFTAMFEVDLEEIMAKSKPKQYYPLNRYPSTEQDMTLKVAQTVPVGDLSSALAGVLARQHDEVGYNYDISVIDIYQKDSATKNVTFRIVLEHPERTLTTTEVNKIFDILEAESKKVFKAERV